MSGELTVGRIEFGGAGGPSGSGRHPRSVDEPLGTVMTENHTASGKNYPKGWYSSALKVWLCVKPLPKTFRAFILPKKWTKRETKCLRPYQGHVKIMEPP